MGYYFLDSSALVKNYVNEKGTLWTRSLLKTRNQNIFYVSSLARVEVLSAFARRVNSGSLSAQDLALLSQQFDNDFTKTFRRIGVGSALLEDAAVLIRSYRLRAYDSVQLASVLQLFRRLTSLNVEPPILISADSELNKAANAENLKIEDPNDHN